MAVLTLENSIKKTGINQGDLVDLLTNLVTVVNELVDDHATNKTTIDECRTAIVELIDDHATMVTLETELKADIGTIATFQAALTAKLDADAGITDTDYAATLTEVAAVTASPPATLTAGDPTASAAALTNSTNLTLNGG